MAGIKYNDIKQTIKTYIEGYSFTYTPQVEVEGDFLFDSLENVINIELNTRNGKSYIANSKKLLMSINVTLTIYIRNYDRQTGTTIRDKMLEELELAILQNPTLNNDPNIEIMMINGGQCAVAYLEDSEAFLSAATIELVIDAIARA